MIKRKTRVRAHVIADMSFHHLAYIIVSCSYTVERPEADYGYDVSVYTFDNEGQYENGNIFVQLKATNNLDIDRKTGEVKFRISKSDVDNWEKEFFPAYLVVFDARTRKAYSTYLQRSFRKANITSAAMQGNTVIVRLPGKDIDVETIRGWRDDKNAVLANKGEVIYVKKGDL